MERKISVFVLFVLLACTFKIRIMTNANGLKPGDAGKVSNMHVDKGRVNTAESTTNSEYTIASLEAENGVVSFDEIEKYIDTRYGSFKSAGYVPNSVLIREYDGGQTMVKNSLIDITYENIQGESHRQVRKIDVFVKNGNNWIRTDRSRVNFATVAAL